MRHMWTRVCMVYFRARPQQPEDARARQLRRLRMLAQLRWRQRGQRSRCPRAALRRHRAEARGGDGRAGRCVVRGERVCVYHVRDALLRQEQRFLEAKRQRHAHLRHLPLVSRQCSDKRSNDSVLHSQSVHLARLPHKKPTVRAIHADGFGVVYVSTS